MLVRLCKIKMRCVVYCRLYLYRCPRDECPQTLSNMTANKRTLSVSNLSISFAGTQVFQAVNDVSFHLNQGDTLAIVGESGSGKSLMALSLIGLQPRTANVKGSANLQAGREQWALMTLSEHAWQALRGNKIGMIFQEPMSALNPIMTVGKQICECILVHQKLSKKAAEAIAIEWLTKVQLPQPDKIYDRFPHQLSGGQKQRVMIAMAMCCNPLLLLADEPTTALDATVQKDIVALMKVLQREHNSTMIFITHDLALAAEIADHILVMYRGACVEYGTTEEVLHHPKQAYTKALLSCRPDVEHKGKRLPVIADFMGNERTDIKLVPVVQNDISLDPILNVSNLQVWFPQEKNLLGKPLSYFKAVNGISFEIFKGETLGLVGESGCGKSTVSRSLMGLAPIYGGKVLFKDTDLAGLRGNKWNAIRRDIQMIFQDPSASLNPRMKVADIISEPLLVHNIMSRKDALLEAKRLIDLVHLPQDSLQRYPHQFSGGQRQRIGIARSLSLKPQLLICDESVSALDVSVQAQILNLLKEIQSIFNLSYLFISHDLSVVHYMSERILVMKQGQIVESGSANDILLRPQELYTQQLIAAMPKK
jgi:peptide/nickel transport system ATP-binding protein